MPADGHDHRIIEIVSGVAVGPALVLDEPLSLWGGLDPATGEVIDRHHPLSGQIVQGRILMVPHGRGSCSASGVLLEAIRNGTAPAGIIVSTVDPILGLGAILGEELLGRVVPVILVSRDDWRSIPADRTVNIAYGGRVEW